MNFWSSLSDGQRRLFLAAVPIVAVVALLSSRRRAAAEAAAATKPTGNTPPPVPSTDAIGVGQLASFESGLTDYIGGLYDLIGRDDGSASSAPPVATTSTSTTAPAAAPAPAPSGANCLDPALGFACCAPGQTASPITVQGQTIGVTCSGTATTSPTLPYRRTTGWF